jgi:predicted dehydrogenase
VATSRKLRIRDAQGATTKRGALGATGEDIEMKEIGDSHTSRRGFLKSVGGGLALGLTAANYRALAGVPPSDTIQMGFIGVGGMGTSRLKGFMEHPDVNVQAICDVDENHLNAALSLAEKTRGRKPKGFGDFRRLLEMKEIDAVTVVTPDHWHALPAIEAFKAGKDVFVEKPLSYSVGEGRAMVRAVRANNRISQMGNHIHNDLPNYRRVVELVRSGLLGKITRVSCWKTSPTRTRFDNPPDGEPPATLDYDFWLGPAPKRPYNPNRSHYSFRYFWDYSGGVFIDFWCHITDVAVWALDLKGPKSVAAIGGRFFWDDNTETPDSLNLIYEFPGLDLTWTLNPMGLPGIGMRGGIGCAFQGTEATVITNYSQHEVYVRGKKVDDFKHPEPSIPDSPGHLREFLNSIKSRQITTCDIEYGHRLSKVGLLGNLAFRTGRKLQWDDEQESFIGDSEANSMITRQYREPWKLT